MSNPLSTTTLVAPASIPSPIPSMIFAPPAVTIGMDVGASNIRVALVEQPRTILAEAWRATPRGDRDGIPQLMLNALDQIMQEANHLGLAVAGVGVGIPGTVNIYAGRFVGSANLGVRDIPVRRLIEDHIGLPCWVENDVRAATVGELLLGAGRQVQNLLYLSVGTGIATGFVLDGRLYRGPAHRAGEFGHSTIDVNGPLCHCGRRGCLETLIAGPAIRNRLLQMASAYPDTPLGRTLNSHPDHGNAIDATTIFQRATQGDLLAQRVADDVTNDFYAAINNLFALLNPELIVLGGGVFADNDLLFSRLEQLFAPMVARRYQHHGLPYGIALSGLHPAKCGVLGAAALMHYFSMVEPITKTPLHG